MNTMRPERNPLYRNAMEPLVAEEVKQQMQHHSPTLVPYQPQAIAYALNRLPALYTTTEEGWVQQQQKAEKFEHQIFLAARWGLVSVQREPSQILTPLKPPEALECIEARAAQQRLREIMIANGLSWQDLVTVVERAVQSEKNQVA